MSKGFWSTDFVNLFLDFLLSEILVARPRVIRVENKVLSPLSSYQGLPSPGTRIGHCTGPPPALVESVSRVNGAE